VCVCVCVLMRVFVLCACIRCVRVCKGEGAEGGDVVDVWMFVRKCVLMLASVRACMRVHACAHLLRNVRRYACISAKVQLHPYGQRVTIRVGQNHV
jgi:hypothetical protein